MKQAGAGKVVSMLSGDLTNLEKFSSYSHAIIASPFSGALYLTILGVRIKWVIGLVLLMYGLIILS